MMLSVNVGFRWTYQIGALDFELVSEEEDLIFHGGGCLGSRLEAGGSVGKRILTHFALAQPLQHRI